ncbi:MAG: TIGR04282 family arsenosugar biosynthesis glycosyltransferase [Parvularculaceae bacterium]
MKGTLIIFLKAPVAGRVKTRLARDLGHPRAAALFRHMTQLTISRLSKGNWRTILAIDGTPNGRGFDNLWPLRLPRMVQSGGDLGARMARAFSLAPPGPTIIIGADVPEARAEDIRAALFELGRKDAVFGASPDGGYWLIGLARRRSAPALFDGVRWSSRHALADTKKSLPEDFSFAEIEMRPDIDEIADLNSTPRNAFYRSRP